MSVVQFPRVRHVTVANDNTDTEDELFCCAACKQVLFLAILSDGELRIECAGCHADLSSGVLPYARY